MHAAALRIELRVPLANSLKAKRAVVRPLIEGLRRTASLSVSEIDHHDSWQLATVGVAIVAPDATHLERLIGQVQSYLDGCIDLEVIEIRASYLEEPS